MSEPDADNYYHTKKFSQQSTGGCALFENNAIIPNYIIFTL